MRASITVKESLTAGDMARGETFRTSNNQSWILMRMYDLRGEDATTEVPCVLLHDLDESETQGSYTRAGKMVWLYPEVAVVRLHQTAAATFVAG